MSATTTPNTDGSFQKRVITVTIALGTGAFGETGQNVITVSGLRVSAKITRGGGAAMSGCTLNIWGLPTDQMNQMSTLGFIPASVRKNSVSVSAGYQGAGLTTVFQGNITDAFVNLKSMPESSFEIHALGGILWAMIPVQPTSYAGSTDVATIMAYLVAKAGLTFQNNCVSVKLSNPYYPGTAREQMQRCADAANINWDDTTGGALTIWPKNTNRGGSVPVISPATGMIGYPTYQSRGIALSTLWTPSLTFGGAIQVQSDLPQANGTWNITKLDFDLESEMPGGNWLARVEATPVGFGPAPPR